MDDRAGAEHEPQRAKQADPEPEGTKPKPGPYEEAKPGPYEEANPGPYEEATQKPDPYEE